MGGLKMANGTNSMREPPFPGTRGKSAFLVREQYIKAREYHDKIVRAAGDPAKLPPRDLNLEALVEAMQGKRIVHHHTHRHDDIMTVLRLAQGISASRSCCITSATAGRWPTRSRRPKCPAR